MSMCLIKLGCLAPLTLGAPGQHHSEHQFPFALNRYLIRIERFLIGIEQFQRLMPPLGISTLRGQAISHPAMQQAGTLFEGGFRCTAGHCSSLLLGAGKVVLMRQQLTTTQQQHQTADSHGQSYCHRSLLLALLPSLVGDIFSCMIFSCAAFSGAKGIARRGNVRRKHTANSLSSTSARLPSWMRAQSAATDNPIPDPLSGPLRLVRP